MKINNSTIINFFIIYVSCIDKSKNVEIRFSSVIYVTEGMCEKKVFKTIRLGSENQCNFYGGAIFLVDTVSTSRGPTVIHCIFCPFVTILNPKFPSFSTIPGGKCEIGIVAKWQETDPKLKILINVLLGSTWTEIC